MSKKMHKVTVAGQYYTREGRNKVLSNFEESFDFNDKDWPMALPIIQNKLLKPRLKSIDPNADSYRTCAIISGHPPEIDEDADQFAEPDIDQDIENMAEAESEISADVNLDTGRLESPETPKRSKKVTRKTGTKGRKKVGSKRTAPEYGG